MAADLAVTLEALRGCDDDGSLSWLTARSGMTMERLADLGMSMATVARDTIAAAAEHGESTRGDRDQASHEAAFFAGFALAAHLLRASEAT